jgi:hypothetical protein
VQLEEMISQQLDEKNWDNQLILAGFPIGGVPGCTGYPHSWLVKIMKNPKKKLIEKLNLMMSF